ncbi:putative succinate-semialdehyde dehydrogenase [NADP(+)] [Colletotrichum fructicola]|uniref:Putative succinate-semialdehyde dehydrogenase n=1 Tax=Colletotrichum fructicola (strain Nara gc5) TaxID=1213859 RepID=A0A7J6JN91_COLFN|nr:putative succinate-semialdehyde dehydrogenase [NADP(+)] [Colletotrichum fructicola]KAE9566581.1 putative succinate-semialdehyde dehydrogenase [NADP(+)] [Colletotrichum fructicola]KAF4492015.1 putative succinate-semialdehyde dehydrogenase [Colletotrichum fructicola Nara gc5]KAF5508878.1 putative succinate-semialdehyde dehydrogenase [Colletotrichum fructicola]
MTQVKDDTLFIQKCHIDGQWTEAATGQTFEVHDPATGHLVGTCPECDATDAESAIRAAENAFGSFSQLTGRQRSKILRKWYDLMVENLDDIAILITWESGKAFADAKGEAVYAANFLEWFSIEATRSYGDTFVPTTKGMRVHGIKQPIGVCGLITPWNFPAAMVTRKVAPALAAGCTVVLKTPGETPFTANAVAELGKRAGLPPGVFNIVTALENTPKIGLILTTSPAVKKVSFTGSTDVGKLLMKQASSTIKKLSLELGGNAPFIVFDDAKDIDSAVAGCIAAKFRSNGQTCVCANRIYVQSGVYEQFAAKLKDKVESSFKVGLGFDAEVTHVLTGVKDTMDVAAAETFGPVAALFSFDTEQEVIQRANSCRVGLAGYVYSGDLDRVYRVAEQLEVGKVGINTGLISDPATPFGGVKESGFGKEGSKYGIDEYLVTKTITISHL